MRIATGSSAHARLIANIYRKAFPESIQLFFGKREPENLLDFLEASFQFVFYWGGQAFLAETNSGQAVGYCLYSWPKSPKDFKNALLSGMRLLKRIRIPEARLLAYNQLLKVGHRRQTRPRPQQEGSILSIAVAPPWQGQGAGSRLLAAALGQLQTETVLLSVRRENKPARQLYKQAGFFPYGTTKDLLGEWVLLKRVN